MDRTKRMMFILSVGFLLSIALIGVLFYVFRKY